MPGREHAEQLWTNIVALGTRRLVALGLIGLTVFLAVSVGAYYLSRPAKEILYSGLERDDVSRIGSVLKDAAIPFDVSADGTSVLVSYGSTAQARMLLAEKGLPQSAKSGYELFNDLGSLGLTSFMQEVTRVRALEGELARTIQTIKGVRAARVHIVMPDRGSFRREQQAPSASVVVRTEPADDATSAQAIRHLVAAAIPSLKPDRVTVLNTHGTVLASGDDPSSAATGRMAVLEKAVSREVQDSIRRTLAPYLGVSHFEVSVTARLNTDRTSTNETVFNPDQKVERSVRTIKENEVNQNRASQRPTTVQQNLPEERNRAEGAENSSEENQRREELTNYEISSKTIQTVSDGYAIRNLSIAVLVDRDRIAGAAGSTVPQETLDAKLSEIQQLVSSAAGFDRNRGDQMKVLAVNFLDGQNLLEPIPPLGIGEILARQLGNVINAVTILVVAGLLIWFGLRPAVTAILARPEQEQSYVEARELAADSVLSDSALLRDPDLASEARLLENRAGDSGETPQKRLERLVEADEDRAVAILKQWLMEAEAEAA